MDDRLYGQRAGPLDRARLVEGTVRRRTAAFPLRAPGGWRKPEATPTPWSITPPPWAPQHVSEIDEPEEIANYAHGRMGFDVVWGAYYVKWTSKDDIKNLIEGWSLIATPDLAGPISPDEEAVWIVGFHSPDPLPVHRVLGGAGFPSDERPEDWPDFHAGFMVMDRAGFVKRAGTVPETLYGPDGTPTPRPDAWDIADIAGLRPAPPPPTPRPTPGP